MKSLFGIFKIIHVSKNIPQFIFLKIKKQKNIVSNQTLEYIRQFIFFHLFTIVNIFFYPRWYKFFVHNFIRGPCALWPTEASPVFFAAHAARKTLFLGRCGKCQSFAQGAEDWAGPFLFFLDSVSIFLSLFLSFLFLPFSLFS